MNDEELESAASPGQIPEADGSPEPECEAAGEAVPDGHEQADLLDALRSENLRMADELAALRRSIREDELRRELIRRGAHEAAVPLLLLAANGMADGDDLPGRIQADYGAFFAQTARSGTPAVTPPGTGMLPRSAVAGMTPDEINRSWDHVRTALGQ